MKKRQIYQFGNFRLDATAKVLLQDGNPLHVPRKAVEVLLVLTENAGQVLTKDELMSTVWPERVVDEANLTQNVAVIRRALGVERGAPGYIETFPGTGYRIVGPVTVVTQSGASAAPTENGAGPSRRPSAKRFVAAAVSVVVLAGLAAWWVSRREAPAPEESRRASLTRLAGKEYQPVISPDGESVAFLWTEEGAQISGVWVQRDGENTPRRITPAGANCSSPSWSPDARRLAYLRFTPEAGEIVVAPLEEGVERIVAKVSPSRYGLSNRHLDWSPDGRFLAVDDVESGSRAFGIFLVTAATGEKKRLTEPEDVIIGDVDPRFSPDGKTLSFIRAFHRARQELFAVPVAGGAPVALTDDSRQVSGQDWMPDGRSLVVSSDRSGEFRLWKLAFPVTGAGRLQSTAIYGDFPIQLSVARRAQALVYCVLQHKLNIWRLDLAAGAKSQSRWTQLVASSGQDASPQYSPQGDRICFRSDRSGEEQIWVCDRDGGNPVQVTQGRLRPSVARWSPDGRAIAFNNSQTSEIFIAKSGAGGTWAVRKLDAQGIHPVFSLDGQWIYAGTMSSIIRSPVEGGASREIVKMMGISLGMSGDGRHIYFAREPAGSALWRVDATTGRSEEVLEGLVPYCSSCWALAPRGIYYLGNRPGSMHTQALYFHDFTTGKSKTVADYPEPVSPIGSGPFSLSPDGRYLLCVRLQSSNADLFRVEPFR